MYVINAFLFSIQHEMTMKITLGTFLLCCQADLMTFCNNSSSSEESESGFWITVNSRSWNNSASAFKLSSVDKVDKLVWEFEFDIQLGVPSWQNVLISPSPVKVNYSKKPNFLITNWTNSSSNLKFPPILLRMTFLLTLFWTKEIGEKVI